MCSMTCIFPNMDLSSWITIASIMMALLSLFVTGIDKEEAWITNKTILPLLKFVFCTVIFAMLLFIFNVKETGAIIITCVLLMLLLFMFLELLKINVLKFYIERKKKKITDDLVEDIHKGISNSTLFEQ